MVPKLITKTPKNTDNGSLEHFRHLFQFNHLLIALTWSNSLRSNSHPRNSHLCEGG